MKTKVTETRSGDNVSGSALITVMIVLFTVMALAGSLLAVAKQRSFMTRQLADRAKAVAIAEAGVNKAYSILVTNWAARSNSYAFPAETFGGGNYVLNVRPLTNNVAIITSTGYCGLAEATVVLDAKNYGSTSPGWDSNVLNYAILCGGNLSWGGCGSLSSTNGTVLLHANGELDLTGNANVGGDVNRLDIESSSQIDINNNVTINGDVASPTNTYRPAKVTINGTVSTEPIPLVTIPTIDLTPYYQWAFDHGEVHPAGWTPPAGDYTPNGGIVWIEGDTGTISSHGTLNGSIISTGDIKISGDYNIRVPTNGYGFAMATRDGNIDNQSSGTIEGVVYARVGDYTQTANGTLIGQIIVGGDVQKGGESDVIIYRRTDLLPPGDPSGGDDIGVSAWQK